MYITEQHHDTPIYASGVVVGRYSDWPKKSSGKRFVAGSAIAGAIGLFVHCGLPLIS